MAKVSVATLATAAPAAPPEGFAGGETRAFFASAKHPLHCHLHVLSPGETLRIAPPAHDHILYVWQGEAGAGDISLTQGSSLIVEHGAAVTLAAGAAGVRLLDFAAAAAVSPARTRGQVHLLPRADVPHFSGAGGSGTDGAMHADASSASELWLHENAFSGLDAAGAVATGDRGVHAHTEDEVIFVTEGQIRLGTRLYGPGTALAIAADTLYSFTSGPEGLRFINFRAGRPGDIRFKSGATIDEVGYWRERLAAPRYTTL